MASCSPCWRSWTSGQGLVYPVYGMRVDTPEAGALVVMIFYGGLHAIYLLLAVATIVLSLAIPG